MRHNQELPLEEEIPGNDNLCATGAKECRDGGQQVDRKDESVLNF